MASLYPAGLDELNAGVGAPNDPLSAPSHPAHHTALADAVEAVQTELGTDPSGAAATVKARLDGLDTTVSGKAASSHSHAQGDVTGLVTDLAGKIPASLVDAKGDIIAATADNTVARLGVGTDGQVLTADSGQSTGLKWSTPAAETLPASTVDAKGDLLVATADNTVARLGVGTNGHVLTADSAQSSGVKWAAAAGGGSAPPAPSPYIVRSGHYYPNNMGAVSLSTYSVVADQVFYVPILFSESAAVTQIGLYLMDVGVAGGGSATGCLGIYSNSASNQPSSLIVSAGTMDLTATPGGRFLTISQTLAANTLYWLAFAHGLTGTNPKMRGPTYGAQQGATLLGAHNLDSFNNSMVGQWHRATFGWVEARTYDGTVPASVGTLTALRVYDVNFPVVSVKL